MIGNEELRLKHLTNDGVLSICGYHDNTNYCHSVIAIKLSEAHAPCPNVSIYRVHGVWTSPVFGLVVPRIFHHPNMPTSN